MYVTDYSDCLIGPVNHFHHLTDVTPVSNMSNAITDREFQTLLMRSMTKRVSNVSNAITDNENLSFLFCSYAWHKLPFSFISLGSDVVWSFPRSTFLRMPFVTSGMKSHRCSVPGSSLSLKSRPHLFCGVQGLSLFFLFFPLSYFQFFGLTPTVLGSESESPAQWSLKSEYSF